MIACDVTDMVDNIFGAAIGFAIGAVLLPAMQVWAQPANRPLLTNQSGAKPNLMVTLDNSGSMAFTYHESYNITSDTEYQRRPEDHMSQRP